MLVASNHQVPRSAGNRLPLALDGKFGVFLELVQKLAPSRDVHLIGDPFTLTGSRRQRGTYDAGVFKRIEVPANCRSLTSNAVNNLADLGMRVGGKPPNQLDAKLKSDNLQSFIHVARQRDKRMNFSRHQCILPHPMQSSLLPLKSVTLLATDASLRFTKRAIDPCAGVTVDDVQSSIRYPASDFHGRAIHMALHKWTSTTCAPSTWRREEGGQVTRST